MQAHELKIVRTFDAPRELVWKAWTDASMVKEWMGPRGFVTTECVTPGAGVGAWRMKMEGRSFRSHELAYLGQSGTVLEFDPPKLLKYTFAWDVRAAVGLPESPYKENVVTVQFEERGEKTVMTFTQGPFATESERDGHTGGWNSSFDRFAEFILAERPKREPAADEVPSELHRKRFFAAPLVMVFDAWTKAEMLAQWWGPEGFTNPVCEVEARGGGAIRIHMRGPDGTVYPTEGRFVEFYAPHRLHFTLSPMDADGNSLFENWNSVYFEEVDGGTQVTLDVHVTKQQAGAEQHLKGMTAGWNQSLERLERWIASR